MDKIVKIHWLFEPHSKFESVNQMIWEMNEIIEYVKLSMKSAQDRMKRYVENKFWGIQGRW